MTPEQIKAKYEKRIYHVLNAIARSAREHGMKASRPFEMSDEEYQYWMTIYPDGKRPKRPREADVDVVFTIVESEARDGEADGVAFDLSITGVDGRIIGGMCPYNYTNDLWVSRNSPEDVEQRFGYFEQAEPDEAITLIENSRR